MSENKFKVQDPNEKKGKGLFSYVENWTGMHFMEDGLPVKYLPYMLYIVAILIFYIGNNHFAEKTVRKITKLEAQVEDLRADYTTLKADYMFASKQSEVAKRVKKLGLKESEEPPYKIVVSSDEY